MLTNFEAYQTATPEATPAMVNYFVGKYGYPPDETEVHEVKTFKNLFHVRLGPCYQTRKISAGEVMPGMLLLMGEVWERVADCDNQTVLTESDNLITLPEFVIIRN